MKYCLNCENIFQSVNWQCPKCNYHPDAIGGRLFFAPELAEENEGFKSESFDDLYMLENNNFWFRSRNKLIIWALKKYFTGMESCLEIGCGTGFVLAGIEKAFPDVRLSGSEIYRRGLEFASRRVRRADLFQMDARAIPFEKEFDVISCFDVLEHIEDDETVLKQMYRALKQGGGIILTVPQHDFLWSRLDDCAKHVRRYSAADIMAKVKRSGFRVVKTTSFVTLLFPLLFLSRFRLRSDETGSFDPSKELRISGWKNAVLEKILTIERGLIRLGFAMPVGGSLLLIAKKGPVEKK